MSLMQLLTVGHSFMDVKNAPSPYRVNRRGLLPRFDAVPVAKVSGAVTETGTVGEKPAITENFIEPKQTLMTPETGSMAFAASEATVPASSAPIIESEPEERVSGRSLAADLMRPRVKLREDPSGAVPGTVVVKENETKVFKKLGLGRLYWPAWMFASAMGEPNRRRGTRNANRQPVRVARNSMSLSDVTIVAAPAKRAENAGWKTKPHQAWNWLTGRWRRSGSGRR